MALYRKPTEAELKKIRKARKMTQQGIQGENDIFSKISTTMRKAAKDEYNMGRKLMESVPEEARNYEAEMPEETLKEYKAGGIVKVRGQGAARKTKGCKIT